MPKLLLSLLSLTSVQFISAQGYNFVGARSASLSGSSVCLTDAWAYHHNPGAVAAVTAFSAGVYYDARFVAKELQTQALAVALPLRTGVISAGGQFTGYSQYRTTRAGLGYALGLGEKFSAGVQLNLQQLKFGGNYGSANTATAEAGILAKISEKWSVGASVMNIGRQRVTSGLDERYPSLLRMGMAYIPSKTVTVTAEIQKEIIHPVSVKAGIEYQPAATFFIRGGAQTSPAGCAFGVGYKKSNFAIDAGSGFQQVLGFTPHFGLRYQFAEHAAR